MFLIGLLAAACVAFCSGNNNVEKTGNLRNNYMFDGEKTFKETALANTPTTDKVTNHSYQKMYGKVLLPLIEKFWVNKKKLKFLEIGLGCDMNYGPGASVKVWKQIFEGRDVDIWEAEFDADCVKKAKAEGKLEGINTLTGDQADPEVLKRWIDESGGKFDVIIDDGGHKNDQVLNSFHALWPQLNADGNYFIEDLQVAYNPKYIVPNVPAVTKVLQAWVEVLHVGSVHEHHRRIISAYPLPEGVDSITCLKQSCVLHKQELRR